MKNKIRNNITVIAVLTVLMPFIIKAQNPIIQTNYTADPAPMVHNGTVYLYTTHDEDKTIRNFFTMNDWRCYSSTDMVNWTDHGAIMSYKDIAWSRGDAWAGQCIYRNGKFYFYFPVNQKNGGNAIGVAVSDSPTGPFKDAIGAPLLVGYGYIDPAVFIDDDAHLPDGQGQAYLYWGNPHLWYVKLNDNMISYDQKVGIVQVPLTAQSFKLRVINAQNTFAWAKSVDGINAHNIRNDKDQKNYWYVSAIDKNTNKKVIGVAVGDRAIGPFADTLGKPLICENCGEGDINPTVVYDDDKQPYLVWENSELWYAKLNSNMVSIDPGFEIRQIPTDKKDWFAGKIKGTVNSTEKRQTTYEEGPWVYKRNNLYYLFYPAGGVPEHLAYSTSKSLTNPQWVYGDTVMGIIKKGGAFTNHPAVIDYKGKTFLFYHNGALPGGGGFKRSVCVDEMNFRADGSVQRVEPTEDTTSGVDNLNPFLKVEAATIAFEKGIETAIDSLIRNVYVSNIDNSDYIKVRSVDFGKGAKSFEASVASVVEDGSIEIRIDSLTGTLLGTCNIINTGGMQKWATASCKTEKIKGIHDIYFVFEGVASNLFNFDWWRFVK
jgi:arabinoxylan arabinofuranohydrolase